MQPIMVAPRGKKSIIIPKNIIPVNQLLEPDKDTFYFETKIPKIFLLDQKLSHKWIKIKRKNQKEQTFPLTHTNFLRELSSWKQRHLHQRTLQIFLIIIKNDQKFRDKLQFHIDFKFKFKKQKFETNQFNYSIQHFYKKQKLKILPKKFYLLVQVSDTLPDHSETFTQTTETNQVFKEKKQKHHVMILVKLETINFVFLNENDFQIFHLLRLNLLDTQKIYNRL
eukprot:TRINITY_DN1541_c0_g2_i3.p1 TRINITY_DN1541_c0_g2~~TRINITY_DN1541_c0_g2_i3.p1  ORF type:complete len:224 (+),score=-8.19 TRINITY_DN1541_c0_g2_i3:493-1164(+)